ncbi:MAG: hypothetical protein FJW36_04140 [Acidobacteria bacterium]|nr:hypothetical protein [Acidobacteriota bacterium]
MASDKQIAANRRNALNSTGPRTRAGKLKTSLNALRHGMYSEKYIVKTEDESAFQSFAQGFLAEFDPQTPSEFELVDTLIQTAWRRRRVSALIASKINEALDEIAPAPPATPAEAESLTLQACALAESTDPSLARLESHELRLVSLFIRTLQRLHKIVEQRNKANLRQNPLLSAA